MFSTIEQRLAIFSDRLRRQQNLVECLVNKREKLDTERYNLEGAIQLIDRCLKEQTNSLAYIENLVTSLLQTVHGPDYAFRLELVYKKDGVTLQGIKPLIGYRGLWDDHDEQGDGIQATAALGFRLALLLFDKTLAPVMLCDELAPSINERHWATIIKFFQDLYPDVEFQFTVITHTNAQFPKTYRVTLDKGTSKVVELNP